MYITLQCISCDNVNCRYGRYFIPDDSLEGCTRKVSEEQWEKLEHLTKEVLPFIPMYKNRHTAQDKLQEISTFLDEIYSCPLGKLLDAKGKVIESPKIADKRLNRVSM